MRVAKAIAVLLVAVIAFVGQSRQAAKADPIIYNFAGTLDQVVDNSGWLGDAGFVTGLGFSGQFTYNPDAPFVFSGGTWDGYSGGGGIEVSFGQGASMKDASSVYSVQDYPTLADSFTARWMLGASMNFSHDYDNPEMTIVLEDSTEAAFDSRAVPSALILSLFDTARFSFSGLNGESGEYDHLSGTITELSAIPLPPSALLFGTALLGLAAMRRRKRKTTKATG